MKGVATLLLAVVLAGCAGTRAAEVPSQGVTAPVIETNLASASTRFSIDLLKEVYRSEPGKNHFLSPTSASIILSLTANGAKGETQAAMIAGLRCDTMSLEAINQANQGLQALLANPDPKVELSVANAIWHAKELKVAPSFAATAMEQYRASIRPAVFGTPEALAAINGWVKDETRGKIPSLLDETGRDDAMWLVNALYFKGAWSKPFEQAMTHQRPFHLVAGGEKQLPFMHRRGEVEYLAADGVQGVRLPYGEEGNLALYAIMPDRWEGFVDGLTPERWESWVRQIINREVILGFPKVKLEYQAELRKPLAAMGMAPAFDERKADLSGLFTTPGRWVISEVIQKTFLEINEEGTEAAAATAVGVRATAAPAALPELVLDRPFLLAIRDDRSGVLLFLGTVLEP